MPCGCGGQSSVPTDFEVTFPDGSKTTFHTEVEARAALTRAGQDARLRTVPRGVLVS